MSDEYVTITINMHVVERNKLDKLYYVYRARKESDGGVFLEAMSKGYAHSTSAYAKLGRMVQHMVNMKAAGL